MNSISRHDFVWRELQNIPSITLQENYQID